MSLFNNKLEEIIGLEIFTHLKCLLLIYSLAKKIDFTKCESLEILNISNSDNITNLDFSQNKNLKSLVLVNNKNLESINIKNNNNDALKYFKVSNCPKLKEIIIDIRKEKIPKDWIIDNHFKIKF